MKKGVKGVWDKYKYAALIILTGVILMILPKTAGNTAKTDNTGKSGIFENLTGDLSDGSTSDLWMNPAAGDTRDIREIQREMEETLGRVSGVGRVKVLLTEEDDGERNLAEDISLNTRGETEDYSRESRTVLIDAGSGTDTAIVTRTRRPAYRGALIVCEGGDRASVRLAVTRAVSALTGLSAGRIAVEKWEESG